MHYLYDALSVHLIFVNEFFIEFLPFVVKSVYFSALRAHIQDRANILDRLPTKHAAGKAQLVGHYRSQFRKWFTQVRVCVCSVSSRREKER